MGGRAIGTEHITIYVKAKNAETVLFWLIPTGTQTWEERVLIGYDIKDNKSIHFSFNWKIDRPLHNHLHVQVLGGTGIAADNINITSE